MYSYLALGDSYTIGEQVLLHHSFPYQTVQLLRESGFNFHAPEIVAVTGYTSGELNMLIDSLKMMPAYDFVSLLIGVNNQYRGLSLSDFAIEFEHLLKRAIQFANGLPSHVFVLSIPDWGKTPFAVGKDLEKIEKEIDTFNECCAIIAAKYGVKYLDITTHQRLHANDKEYLVTDALHPSQKEYAYWSQLLADAIRETL